MMKALRLGMVVARTEAALCARSWIFRFLVLFSIGAVGFYSGMLFFVDIPGSWMVRGIPTLFPYFVFLMLTVFESLIIVFGAVESIRREYAMNVYQSLHARDFATIVYLSGKAIGVVIPFIILNLCVFVLAFGAQIFFRDQGQSYWMSFLIYPLLLSVPALLFMTGVTFAVTVAVKSEPVAILILSGWFAATFLYREGISGRLIDVAGMHQPMLVSSVAGFGDLPGLLFQRGFVLFLGIGAFFTAALFFRRPFQSPVCRRVTCISSAVFIALAIGSAALFTLDIHSGIRLRERIRALNMEYAARPRPRLVACDLDVVHEGSRLAVTADLTLQNRTSEPLGSVSLSLNPGFSVRSVTGGGTALDFTRDTQIIDIAFPAQLAPGAETILTVVYDGTVDDDACYPDADPADRIRPHRYFTYVMAKRHGFVTPDYVLVTPECQWYPVPGVPGGQMFPDTFERDFTEFTIDLSTVDGLVAVSQGEVTDSGGGRFIVRPETKLPGLTLVVGRFEKRSLDIDGVEISIFNMPGHDYYNRFVDIDRDELIEEITALKREYENTKGMRYPFNRYSIVETPVQFYAYTRPWDTWVETSPPQLALVPEWGYFVSSLDLEYRMKNRMYSTSYTDDRSRAVQVVGSIIRNVFLNDNALTVSAGDRPVINRGWIAEPMRLSYEPQYTLSSSFYPFVISVESDRYRELNTLFEFYCKYGNNPDAFDEFRLRDALFKNEIACMVDGDKMSEDILHVRLMLGAQYVFGSLGALSGTGEFDAFLAGFIEDHAFESITYECFQHAVEERFGVNMNDLIDDYTSKTRLPMYEASDLSVTEVLRDGHEYYQMLVTITNIEEVSGTVRLDTVLPVRDVENESRLVYLEPHQSKRVGFITDIAPSGLWVHTILSRNLPLRFYLPAGSPDTNGPDERFDGERIVPYAPSAPEPGIIVVDNLDDGFTVISEAEIDDYGMKYLDKYGFGEYPDGFVTCNPSLPPQLWGKAVFNSAYGTQMTAVYTRWGAGDGRVHWETDIPEKGTYDLEYFVADFRREDGYVSYLGMSDEDRHKPLIGNYHLTVHHQDTRDEIVFLPSETQPGWQYVSSFDLDSGPAVVELSNETDGMCIYADAIRWVKR